MSRFTDAYKNPTVPHMALPNHEPTEFGLTLAVLGFRLWRVAISPEPRKDRALREMWRYDIDYERRWTGHGVLPTHIKVEVYERYEVEQHKGRVLTRQRVKVFRGTRLVRSTTNHDSARRKIIELLDTYGGDDGT